MAKKSQKRSSAKRSAAKRDLVRRPKASSYAKRTARGRFKEMDDVGRSQKADKPRKAKRRSAVATGIKVTNGLEQHGDLGSDGGGTVRTSVAGVVIDRNELER